jgi:hypothetical protein
MEIYLLGLLLLFLIVVADIARNYSGTFRRLRRNPRFGLLTLLEIVVVFAVTLSILRSIGLWEYPLRGFDWVPVAIVGFISLVFAVGIVCAVHLLVDDAWDLHRWKKASRRQRRGKTDPWDEGDDANSVTFAVGEGSKADPADEDTDA